MLCYINCYSVVNIVKNGYRNGEKDQNRILNGVKEKKKRLFGPIGRKNVDGRVQEKVE